jgi:hypothetical protein
LNKKYKHRTEKSESLYVLELLLVKEDYGRIDKEKGDGQLGSYSAG